MEAKDLTYSPGLEDSKKEEKMESKGLTRRDFIRGAALTGVGAVAAACAPATVAPTEAPAEEPTKSQP